MDNKSYLQVPGTEDRLGGGGCSSHWRLDNDSNDRYTASIELSNKCREFYKSRVEAANNMKSKWKDSSSQIDSDSETCSLSSSSSSSVSSVNDNENITSSKRQRNSIDQAMEKLRSEMVSLMDQDLSLMKQLLTLNETIEELKWQRQYYSCSTSCASLSNSKNSQWSVSDTEMYDSEDDFIATKHASCGSMQTGHVTGPTWHSMRNARKASKDFDTIPLNDSVSIRVENVDSKSERSLVYPDDFKTCNDSVDMSSIHSLGKFNSRYTTDTHVLTNGPILVKHEREQDSFDSGIHDPMSGDELMWNV